MELSKFELKNLRYKAKGKFSRAKEMFFPSSESLQQSTPEAIALYRAQRLAGDTIIDLGCGIGSDSIALSQFCKKVIAVDVDEKVLKCAEQNAEVYGRKNIEFISADFEELDLQKLKVSAVFSDPSRRVNGLRVKALDQTVPNTLDLIEWIQAQKISDFAIEVSREFKSEEILLDCEKEYISSNCGNREHELNCLTLYFGKFKQAECSLVLVPENQKLISLEKISITLKPQSLQTYLYELHAGIDRAGLYSELLKQLPETFYFQPNFLTSNQLLKNVFFKNRFQVVGMTQTEAELILKLQELQAQKIVLRGKIPEEKYAELKNRIESNLHGTQKVHVFFGKPFLICKNLDLI
ncbi:MAG: class I SAM-dependent methyltransferase [Candidatus Diapherotrites archaeon]|nr:class I SAM-dependent methyltransferase [Candidatus Diapherotrites archaeon]